MTKTIVDIVHPALSDTARPRPLTPDEVAAMPDRLLWPEAEPGLLGLAPGELAESPEAAGLVARFVRAGEAGEDGQEAVRVAAFNSFI